MFAGCLKELLQSRLTNIYQAKCFNNKQNSLSCKCYDKIQLWSKHSICYLLCTEFLILIIYFPNRPIQPRRAFERLQIKTCNCKSCSVVTQLLDNYNIFKIIIYHYTWTTQGLLAKAIISLSSQKNAESDLFIISNLLRSFIAYTLLEDLCLTYEDKCDIQNILVRHINIRRPLNILLFLLHHLTSFIIPFTFL